MSDPSIHDVRDGLVAAAPGLAGYIFTDLAARLIRDPPLVISQASKIVNDPIWKIIKLENHEISILDLPLMQRLRRVNLGWLT